MGDIRNKIAKIEGLKRERAILGRLVWEYVNAKPKKQTPRKAHPHDYGPDGPRTMIGTPFCICGAYATICDDGEWVCEQHTDAALNRASLIREAWRKR